MEYFISSGKLSPGFKAFLSNQTFAPNDLSNSAIFFASSSSSLAYDINISISLVAKVLFSLLPRLGMSLSISDFFHLLQISSIKPD